MFSSMLGRGRFFLYSALLLIAEIFATVFCIAATTGFKGLAESQPGPGREGLALAILIVSLLLVLARSSLAWRRTRDAEGSKFILWMYIVFSAFFAVLQAGAFLVFDFNGENSNLGLNLLGLVLMGLWINIWLKRSTGGGSWDADDFAAKADAEVRARHGINDDPMPSAAFSPAPAVASPPMARAVARDRRPAGFGKRGLA